MENYKKQLQAFFHDPLDKPIKIRDHEKRASEQLGRLGLQYQKPRHADHIASAADRLFTFKDSLGNTIQVDFDAESEISHPLGSAILSLRQHGSLGIDTEQVSKLIIDYLDEVKEKHADDYQKVLFRIWREFPDKVLDKELPNYRLGNLWNFMPADTRIPNHSVLSHNWLVSAIEACGDNIVFSKFSIGPVQSFISTAKRTEDFWMGSYILSCLISKGILCIFNNLGPQHIIFPYVKGQPFIDHYLSTIIGMDIGSKYVRRIYNPSLSNIVFFICPRDKYEGLISSIENEIKLEWENFTGRIRDYFGFSGYSADVFNAQTKQFLEFYSAGVNVNIHRINDFVNVYNEAFNCNAMVNSSGYKTNLGNYWDRIYDYLDRVFISTKLIRKFEYIEERGRKCSLCGEHSAISESESVSNSTSRLREYWKKLAGKTSFRIDKDGNDRLCGICLSKRMALEVYFKEEYKDLKVDKTFPAVMSIASWPFKMKVLNKICAEKNGNITDLICQYINAAVKIKAEENYLPYYIMKELKNKKHILSSNIEKFVRMDGQWVYIDALENNKEIDKDTARKLINILKKIYKEMGEQPNKYYSILSLDGDEMGKWLSGTHDKWPVYRDIVHSKLKYNLADENILADKIKLAPSVHSFISFALNSFSLDIVEKIVEEFNPGKLVYSGGDDVFAILPFEYGIRCAEQLRFFFSGNVNENLDIDLNNKFGFYKIGKEIIPTMGNNATMSAGIAFVHTKFNFQTAIKKAKECERSAKTIMGRDSIYMSVMKHSGSEIQTGFKWTFDNKERIIPLIQKVINYGSENELAMNFFSSAYGLIERLDGDQIDLLKSLLKKEISDHVLSKNNKAIIIQDIVNIFNRIIDEAGITEKKDFILRLLLIMRFFVSKGGGE